MTLKLNTKKGAVITSILRSFEIADKVSRAEFKKVVEQYSNSFLKNNCREKDKLLAKNNDILFYQEYDFIRLTNFGKKELQSLMGEIPPKIKESNQYRHNDLIWNFTSQFLLHFDSDIKLKREGATKTGTISDLLIEANNFKIYLEAETGTQGTAKVADKIIRYERELESDEIMVVYSASPKKLQSLNWSKQILLLDSNLDFTDYLKTLNISLGIYHNNDTITQKNQAKSSDEIETTIGNSIDYNGIIDLNFMNYWRSI